MKDLFRFSLDEEVLEADPQLVVVFGRLVCAARDGTQEHRRDLQGTLRGRGTGAIHFITVQ